MFKYWECVDAGSEYCPCHLAETKDCIACSQLRGEEFCDCQWNGVCILNEYVNNMRKVNFRKEYYEGYIIEEQELEENLVFIKINTDKNLINKLKEPGSYIFIRGVDDQHYFETPMVVFKIDSEDSFCIVYQKVGCKTKKIGRNFKIAIKGPYWNGILGSKYLKNIANEKCLIIARGIGQSSILLPIEKLISNNNSLLVLLDKGKLDSLYSYDYIKSLNNIIIKEINIFEVEGDEYISNILKEENIKLVLSAGSNMLHRTISNKLKQLDKKPYFLTSNNGPLCCGEGVCGSCTMKTIDGSRVKLCKTLITPNRLY